MPVVPTGASTPSGLASEIQPDPFVPARWGVDFEDAESAFKVGFEAGFGEGVRHGSYDAMSAVIARLPPETIARQFPERLQALTPG